ncbi:PQQ-binding-like beta-propeller repeat protein [Mycobacterium marinum]|uniref:PQQ-binding-like beta-propeller repeat protein n=1 Tax=Mycobacterium marinum TaxID=1781 RepID=UPI000B961599|nr:PQQ-binding-like beta-propeller repeat protein [Mycobacterium marinum]MDC8982575.1 PQQ-binding-like beta-propeller repeat protein [Mycobacterium marinum]MDC8993894.1 PQQ-binding-like beta-propeller repeat protein [Mycobacterium marinum]MDC8999089.1 PQQ-binding-like beta-propeller repeat protein [Mycobacterium marinum]MDC9011489.1 PQQ-binding-like beta-propeller repeat protein [Mycobacterium marinum]MDC9016507.1 PQQ-binding-like beta-propeller repeat protein [Mycobacterium marinum]
MGTLRNHPVFARRLLTTALAAALTIGLGGCGNTDSWVDAAPALGWPAQYGDAANSSYTTTAGSSKLALKWTRSVKGSLAAGPALSGRGYLALNAQTPAGCSLMEWENNDNGRQRWCVRLVQGGGFAGPLFDGFDNLYVGQPGAIVAFPVTQWTRWRQPVIGMPSTPRFLGNGHLLVATHLGQMLVFDAHRGKIVGSPMDLVEGVDPTDPARGLADCAPARQGCPVAAAPAFSKVNGMVVVGVWQPGAPAAGLVGLKYHAQQLVREWTSDAVKDGVLASPVLSANGETVYVNGRDQRLWALHATDGKVKWSVPLGFLAQTPPTVTPEGLIVSGGGPDTRLAAFRDAGDHADQAWRRDDVTPLSTSSLAAGNVGYTIVAGPPHEGGPGMSLLVFNPADGHTINSYSLPAATGYPVGVSIAVDGRVVTATSDGQVYSFAPA